MGFNWKSALKTVAPTLASALGGPLAGMATTAIMGVLGIEGDPSASDTEDKIAKLLGAASPEIMLKMKQADQKFRVDMRGLDIDLARISQEDVASARGMRVALKDMTTDRLSYLVTLGFFGVLSAHIFIPMPDAVAPQMNIMLGVLGTVWVDQMRFYFGSSMGSKTKDLVLANKLNGGG